MITLQEEVRILLYLVVVNDVFWIYEDGDMTNVNGTFTVNSDIKLKENIVDAPSQWDDIKALKSKEI